MYFHFKDPLTYHFTLQSHQADIILLHCKKYPNSLWPCVIRGLAANCPEVCLCLSSIDFILPGVKQIRQISKITMKTRQWIWVGYSSKNVWTTEREIKRLEPSNTGKAVGVRSEIVIVNNCDKGSGLFEGSGGWLRILEICSLKFCSSLRRNRLHFVYVNRVLQTQLHTYNNAYSSSCT